MMVLVIALLYTWITSLDLNEAIYKFYLTQLMSNDERGDNEMIIAASLKHLNKWSNDICMWRKTLRKNFKANINPKQTQRDW